MNQVLTAKDIMSTEVLTLQRDQLISEARDFFVKHMISGAPVVDEKGRMVGVVTIWDLARHNRSSRGLSPNINDRREYLVEGSELLLQEFELDGFQLEFDDHMAVEDIMTPRVVSVEEETPLQEMANMMLTGKIHRLVVTRQGHLSGIVTTSDMLKVIRDYACH